jgi:hypothetical protein
VIKVGSIFRGQVVSDFVLNLIALLGPRLSRGYLVCAMVLLIPSIFFYFFIFFFGGGGHLSDMFGNLLSQKIKIACGYLDFPPRVLFEVIPKRPTIHQ